MRYLALVLISSLLLLSCTNNNKYPEMIRVRCYPFSTESPIPMPEEVFDTKEGVALPPFMKEKQISLKETIKAVYELLGEITDTDSLTMDYYNLKASIELEGAPDKYYINWDKEYIIYKGKGYKINKEDFQTLSNSIELCK